MQIKVYLCKTEYPFTMSANLWSMGKFSMRCSGLSPEYLLTYLKKGVNRTLIQFSDDLKLQGVAKVSGGEKVMILGMLDLIDQVFLSLKGKFLPGLFPDRTISPRTFPWQDNLTCFV